MNMGPGIPLNVTLMLLFALQWKIDSLGHASVLLTHRVPRRNECYVLRDFSLLLVSSCFGAICWKQRVDTCRPVNKGVCGSYG
jgi:hypothetical protein